MAFTRAEIRDEIREAGPTCWESDIPTPRGTGITDLNEPEKNHLPPRQDRPRSMLEIFAKKP
jgi:hypothetical protein